MARSRTGKWWIGKRKGLAQRWFQGQLELVQRLGFIDLCHVVHASEPGERPLSEEVAERQIVAARGTHGDGQGPPCECGTGQQYGHAAQRRGARVRCHRPTERAKNFCLLRLVDGGVAETLVRRWDLSSTGWSHRNNSAFAVYRAGNCTILPGPSRFGKTPLLAHHRAIG